MNAVKKGFEMIDYIDFAVSKHKELLLIGGALIDPAMIIAVQDYKKDTVLGQRGDKTLRVLENIGSVITLKNGSYVEVPIDTQEVASLLQSLSDGENE